MSNSVIVNAPTIQRSFYNEQANQVIPDLPALEAGEIDGFGQWITAKCTPTNVISSFNPIAGTQSLAGATVDQNLNGFSLTAQANYFRLTAHRLPGATTSLLDNQIIVTFSEKEVGRIYVDAATQKCGALIWHSGALEQFDTRFALSGNGSNITAGTVEADDNIYTKATHGLVTGQRVTLVSLTGGTGLTAGNKYFFHKLSANTGYLCSTYALAIAGTAADVTVDATDVVLTPTYDCGIHLTSVDPALQICIEFAGDDG
jgi:hypothetical protein